MVFYYASPVLSRMYLQPSHSLKFFTSLYIVLQFYKLSAYRHNQIHPHQTTRNMHYALCCFRVTKIIFIANPEKVSCLLDVPPVHEHSCTSLDALIGFM